MKPAKCVSWQPSYKEGAHMKRKLIAIASAAIIGLSGFVAPGKAEAHSNGWWIPGAIVGGLAIGALAARP